MLRASWLGIVAMAVGLALAGAASAGDDDTMSLKLRKVPAASDGVIASDQFAHEERAKADDGDTEEVNLRYRLGYNRGYNGGGYIFPRTYAWRSGHYDGYYGGGYYGGYWPRRYFYGSGYYYPSYYYPTYYTPPVYYSSTITYGQPISGASMPTPTSNLRGSALVPRQQMPEPEPPGANPRTYRYDGNPAPAAPIRKVPPRSDEPAPKFDAADGRLVSLPAAKKHSYPAYGDNRRTQPDADTLLVKQKKN